MTNISSFFFEIRLGKELQLWDSNVHLRAAFPRKSGIGKRQILL